jgi:hypothetical protein
LPKTSGFSLQKYVEAQYDEVVFQRLEQSERDGDVLIKFDFAFSLEGMGAAKLIEGLANRLIAVPGYKWSQIDSEIRFT